MAILGVILVVSWCVCVSMCFVFVVVFCLVGPGYWKKKNFFWTWRGSMWYPSHFLWSSRNTNATETWELRRIIRGALSMEWQILEVRYQSNKRASWRKGVMMTPFICRGCDQPIMERYLMKVLDKSWHMQCVKCSECQCLLNERCFSRDSKLYCRKDFFKWVTCNLFLRD